MVDVENEFFVDTIEDIVRGYRPRAAALSVNEGTVGLRGGRTKVLRERRCSFFSKWEGRRLPSQATRCWLACGKALGGHRGHAESLCVSAFAGSALSAAGYTAEEKYRARGVLERRVLE